MPTLYPVYSTPLIDLLASPLKYTLLRAVPVLAIWRAVPMVHNTARTGGKQ